jgi:hypothetical protein
MTQENTQQPPDFWQHDLLARKDDANYLEKYLTNRYHLSPERDKGFVLAVNADWGVGKTFLLKNWADELIHKKYAAVYFDAWANDFTPEPLVAFIAEIDTGLQAAFKEIPAAKKCLKSAVEVAQQFLKPAGKILLHALLKQGAGLSEDTFLALSQPDGESDSEEADTAEQLEEKEKSKEELKKELAEAFGSVLKEHSAKKNSISAFKEKLGLLISALETTSTFQLPIFIFVDELDRCRPNYAIELLEGIKHLFGVPGIYFVVGTNLAQLGESTKAVYGSGFDGTQYLKRFFDLEYALADPGTNAFAESLFKHVVFKGEVRFVTALLGEANFDEGRPSTIFAMYAKSFQLSLREQQRAMRNIEAVIATIGKKRSIHIHYLCFLVMLQCRAMADFEQFGRSGLGGKTDEQIITTALVMNMEINDPDFDLAELNNGRKKQLSEIIVLYTKLAKLSCGEINSTQNGKANEPSSLSDLAKKFI